MSADMATFYIVLSGILAGTGLVMLTLAVVADRPVADAIRIESTKPRRLGGPKLWGMIFANSILSIAMIYGATALPGAPLFYEGPAVWWRVLLEVAGILVLYDFVYYLAHRFLLHGPIKPLYRVHVLHHTASPPRAQDSLWVHPVETFIGLALMIGSTWVVGPVHLWSFAAMFAIYSFMNVVIHGGLEFRGPWRFIGYMARKHDTHHKSMKHGNYASITPLFDKLFGTAQ